MLFPDTNNFQIQYDPVSNGSSPFAISRSITLLISLIDSIYISLLPASGHRVQKHKKSSYKYFTHNCPDAVSQLFYSCRFCKPGFSIHKFLLFLLWQTTEYLMISHSCHRCSFCQKKKLRVKPFLPQVFKHAPAIRKGNCIFKTLRWSIIL